MGNIFCDLFSYVVPISPAPQHTLHEPFLLCLLSSIIIIKLSFVLNLSTA